MKTTSIALIIISTAILILSVQYYFENKNIHTKIENIIKQDSIRSVKEKKYRDSIFVIISDQEKKITTLVNRKKSVEKKIKVINQTTSLPEF